MATKAILMNSLKSLELQIDQQIDVVRKYGETRGMSPYQVQDRNGAFLMSPLLAAKADVLNAMSNLLRN